MLTLINASVNDFFTSSSKNRTYCGIKMQAISKADTLKQRKTTLNSNGERKINLKISELLGETTEYDKKQDVEIRKPKSWLKSISAFANGTGSILVFGIADDDTVIGIEDIKGASEFVSQKIKERIDPFPEIIMQIHSTGNGKNLLTVEVMRGQETPYYYRGDGSTEAFVRIGNRNPILADIFGRLGYMGRQGSGLNKICEAYENATNYKEGMQPVFYSDRVMFMVTLKNLNYKMPINKAESEAKSEAENIVLTDLERKLCELLKEHPKITQAEIQKQLNLSRPTKVRLLF